MALLRVMVTCIPDTSQLKVAHFQHGTRPDSVHDQVWVARLCAQLGVEFWTNAHKGVSQYRVSDLESVTSAASQLVVASEATLREQRYQFLQDVARQSGCPYLLTAHHADDQIETVVHHLLRGTGLRGLSGIPEHRQLSEDLELLRPLLTIRRQQILEYLESLGQDYLTDSTNFETTFTRNRLRHELLPLLAQFEPQFAEHLLELSKHAQEVQTYHQELVLRVLGEAVLSRSADYVRLLCRPLQAFPDFLIRETFVELWTQQKWSRGPMTRPDWERLARLVHQEKGSESLPVQMFAERRAEMLVISQNA